MSTPNNPLQSPQFIMDDVKLLFGDLTTPETGVKFNPSTRATPATIQKNIGPSVTTSWTWANDATRLAQVVSQDDLGKYGIQTDTNMLFRLGSVSPPVWQTVQPSTTPSWTWFNKVARDAQLVSADDVGRIGIQTDINALYQLTGATPAVWQAIANPTNTSAPFELSTGASDADSYHDFFRLHIAFEDVWAELLDQQIEHLGKQLYAQWDALMDKVRDDTGAADRTETFDSQTVPPDDVASADELQNFLNNLKIQLGITTASAGPSNIPAEFGQLRDAVVRTLNGCNMLLHALSWGGNKDPGHPDRQGWTSPDQFLTQTSANNNNPLGNDLAGFPADTQRQQVFDKIIDSLRSLSLPQSPTAPGITFPDLKELLMTLDAMLKETYRFDVFAPASINYGLLLNYRQHWQPQSYQVGNLVSTIPLAPQETRRYTTKSVIKRTRNVKEIDDSVRSGKDESSTTWRVDAEIVDRAKNQTNFQKNVSGSYGNDNAYKISAGIQQGQDQGVESAQTKREFHESVVKSSQEYRSEHRMEITTEESREDESTTYREIRNPNDELTVTYLFYELQRRYLVDEALHKVTPVILVANEVPGPHQVDQAWILRYDWIIKRAILDDSFLPALEYLSANYTGEELTLQVLGLAVEHQKAVVERISQQVQVANRSLDTATVGLQATEDQAVQDQQLAEIGNFVKGFFDPLGIGQAGKPSDGNSDRARVDFAKDAMNRAQAKVNQLVSDLKTETTALQVAIDKYTAAATKHFSMLADIDRLRVHVKDNIIHYMQAIWTYEPSDQRYFRLYNLDVPVFGHNTTLNYAKSTGLEQIDTSRTTFEVRFPAPTLLDKTMKLHQVADIENLIGFKGNYMIFPMTNFNYMTWFLIHKYINLDEATGVTAKDPDPLANLTIDQLKAAMAMPRTRIRLLPNSRSLKRLCFASYLPKPPK